MTKPNPFGVLSIPDDSDWPAGTVGDELISEAIRLARTEGLGAARGLLGHASPVVRARGLFLFSQLGRQSEPLLADAFRAAGSGGASDWDMLADGVLCFPHALDAEQIGALLKRVETAGPLFQSRVIAIFATRDAKDIEAAVALLDRADRDAHVSALDRAGEVVGIDIATFDRVRGMRGLQRLHGWVVLERLSRLKAHDAFPHESAHDDFIAQGVRWQIVRRSRQWRSNRTYRDTVSAELGQARETGSPRP